MSGPYSQKRRFRRLRMSGANDARVAVNEQALPCTVEDISAGGVKLTLSGELPSSATVQVFITPPGWSRALRLPGRILATESAKADGSVAAHIKFDALSAEPAALLLKLLHALTHQQGSVPTLGRGGESQPAQAPSPAPPPTSSEPATMLDLALIAQLPAAPAGGAAQSPAQPQALESAALKQLESEVLSAEVERLRAQVEELRALTARRERELAEAQVQLAAEKEATARAEETKRNAELALQRLMAQLAARNAHTR